MAQHPIRGGGRGGGGGGNLPPHEIPSVGLSDNIQLLQSLAGLGTPYIEADQDTMAADQWLSYAMQGSPSFVPEQQTQQPALPDHDHLFAVYQTWAAQLAKDANFALGAEPGPLPQTDGYLSGMGVAQEAPSLSGNLFGFNPVCSAAGQASYEEAMHPSAMPPHQFNVPSSAASSPSTPSYDPFSFPSQLEPSFFTESKPRSASLSSVHSEPTPRDEMRSFGPPSSPVLNKPSYSDVAKHRASSREHAHPMPKRPQGGAKVEQASHAFVNSPPASKPHKNHRKARSSKTPAMRSKSMPYESLNIKPDSRYGLDTFEEVCSSTPPPLSATEAPSEAAEPIERNAQLKEAKEEARQNGRKAFLPNNAQNTELNNGKPKSSLSTGITQSCYINNDLRDAKKQTNVEFKQAEKSKKVPTMEPRMDGQRRKHDRRKRHTSESRNAQMRKSAKKTGEEHLLGVWLLKLWAMLCWAVPEVSFIVWNLSKVLLGLAILMLIYAYSSTCLALSYLKDKLFSVFPSLAKRFGSPPSPIRVQPMVLGLRENIELPATGDEAMKRLLACKGKDPYSILGLQSNVTDEEIKRYYRKQAVLVHPDKNQQPGAEEAFKILAHAFDLVGQPEKRLKYDAQLLEDQVAEKATHEFADLLTKLNEKVQEAANVMRCEGCGGKHRRDLVDRPVYSARACKQCNMMHPAREGDVWAESTVMGFLWHYYSCMDSKIYDITEWASCQKEHFKHMRANSHHIIYRISTNSFRSQSTRSPNSEEDLKDFLSHLFHSASSSPGDVPEGFPSPPPPPPTKAPWNTPSNAANTSSSKKGRRRKKKH